MKRISKERLKALKDEVQKEFPKSYGLQQVHLARLIIEEKTKDLSKKELIKYFRDRAKSVKENS